MDNGSLSASDVALLNNDNGFGGMNGLIWLFALIALCGNGGFGFGGNNQQVATRDQVQNAFDTQNLNAQTRDILNAVTSGTAQSVSATNQTFHDTLGIIQNRYDELARDISGLAVGQAQSLANQNECCCNTKMLIAESIAGVNANIAQNKYDNAIALAGLEQRLTSKMDANEIQNLRDQVQALQLAQATSGVVRYPTSTVYSSGCNPFCSCGCGM